MRILVLVMLAATLASAQSLPTRRTIPQIAEAASGAVVSVIMSDKNGQPLAQGSGFVISKDGRIITNYHVIQDGTSAIVKLPDGAFYPVDGVIAFDKDRDIAVIKAHGEGFHTLQFGDSGRVQVGDEVVAIGNPLSLESTVSDGIVSAIRTVQEEGGKFLQVTTPISRGSSGGPLFNMEGQVVGITTMRLEGGENLNFAIPINDARQLVRQMDALARSRDNGPWVPVGEESTSGARIVRRSPGPFPNLPHEASSAGPETPGNSGGPTAQQKTAPDFIPDPPKTGVSAEPTPARNYYNQLYEADGFADVVGHAAKVFVCFNDDASSRDFFTVSAFRFNQEFSDAAQSLLDIHTRYAGDIPTQETAQKHKDIDIMRRISAGEPYINFFPGNAAQWASFESPLESIANEHADVRSGSLMVENYDGGVKTGTALFGYESGSGSWSAKTATTPDSITKEFWDYTLAMEPSTLRYVFTTKVTVVSTMDGYSTTSSNNWEETGACERIEPRPMTSEQATPPGLRDDMSDVTFAAPEEHRATAARVTSRAPSPAAKEGGIQTEYVTCNVGSYKAKVMDWDPSYAEIIVAVPKCGDRVEVLGTLNGYNRVRTSDGKEGYMFPSDLTATPPPPPPSQSPVLSDAPTVISFAMIDPQGVMHAHTNPNGWLHNWINKNEKKFPKVRFQDSPIPGAKNYVIVFSVSTNVLSGLDPVVRTDISTSTTPVSGSGTATDEYGSTWKFTYDGEVTTTTTTTVHDDVPYTIESNTLYATAYDQNGVMVSQRSHVYSTKQGGTVGSSLGYNLGNALTSINARGRLVNAVVKDIVGKKRNR